MKSLTHFVTIALTVCGCTSTREAASPHPMNADGSGPSQRGPEISSDVEPVFSTHDQAEEAVNRTTRAERRASADFRSAPGYQVAGNVQFVEAPEGVRVHVDVTGAPPGTKGIHIHQTADCSDIPNKSMGSHFAPGGHEHGLPEAPEHHLGDLGNITIGPDGRGSLDIVVPGANLGPDDTMSFISRSVVLHENKDQGNGESGNSGTPIACAPIR
jgi:Cu-Zn family superoxide dismutase